MHKMDLLEGAWYVRLATHVSKSENDCTVSQWTLQKQAGCSKKSVLPSFAPFGQCVLRALVQLFLSHKECH